MQCDFFSENSSGDLTSPDEFNLKLIDFQKLNIEY